MDQIGYYQKNCKKIFEAVRNPQWRIWKLYDGFMWQSRAQITTPEKLLKFIMKHPGIQALYVSVSEFLNPHRNHGILSKQAVKSKDGHIFYPRAGYMVADNIILDSYFFMDFDSEYDLSVAQEDARKVIRHMSSNKDFIFKSVQFSGTKGFHLIYEPLKKPKKKKPLDRIEEYLKSKRKLSEEIVKLGLKTIDPLHMKMMQDLTRVYAAPYSLKKNGNVVTPMGLEKFMKIDAYNLICSYNKAIEGESERITTAPDEYKVAPSKAKTLAPQQYSDWERHGLSSQSSFYFADNMINGLKDNYITIIKKHNKRFRIEDIRKIQRIYKLSHFYIERIGDYTYAYNTKALQFKRLVKILKASKSENLSWFLTRKHLPMQLSDTIVRHNNTPIGITEMKTPVAVIDEGYSHDDDHSRFHSRMLGFDYKNTVGETSNIGLMRVSS